jgi:cytochrome b subunit of formate dehydrogenase
MTRASRIYSHLALLSLCLFFLFLLASHSALAKENLFGLVGTAAGVFGEEGNAPPMVKIAVILGRAMKAVFSVLGSIFFLVIVHSGFIWMTARGSKERVERARNKMAHATIALIIILSSYALSNYIVTKTIQATIPQTQN